MVELAEDVEGVARELLVAAMKGPKMPPCCCAGVVVFKVLPALVLKMARIRRVGAINGAFSQLYDDSAVVDVGLRWVDYTNHACLTVARVSTVKPDGCRVVNSKSERFWLFRSA